METNPIGNSNNVFNVEHLTEGKLMEQVMADQTQVTATETVVATTIQAPSMPPVDSPQAFYRPPYIGRS